MITLSKRLALAVSLLALSSWQFVAFGSEPNHAADQRNKPQVVVIPMELEAPKRDMVAMHQTPKEIWKKILTIASTDNHPADLQKVCVLWRNILRENAPPVTDLTYKSLNPFMKLCTDIWIENEVARRFKDGVLRNVHKGTGAVIDLQFSDLANLFCGTFDLSQHYNLNRLVRIITSVEEFFKIRGENENKIVFLVCPFRTVEKAVHSTPDHPFTRILAGWDKFKAPIGMFYRYGNWGNLSRFDHITSKSLLELSSNNLYENWKKIDNVCTEWLLCWNTTPALCENFSCLFLTKQNLDVGEKGQRRKPRI